ncbi:unnamed protein product, partial [Discosporangium mesarthrocarpum]
GSKTSTGVGAGAGAGARVAARRVVALSEELRTSKLEALALRRQVQGHREERRLLEKKLAAAEDGLRSLEEARAEAETLALIRPGEDGELVEMVGAGLEEMVVTGG